MKVLVTGRHVEVTPALRQHILEKLQKLEKYRLNITEAAVTLDVEKYRHLAEINVHVRGGMIQTKEETPEMYASIELAVDKIERQMRRLKEKRRNHRLREAPSPLPPAPLPTES